MIRFPKGRRSVDRRGRLGSSTNPRSDLGQLDDLVFDALGFGGVCCLLAAIVLIHMGPGDALSGGFLHDFGRTAHLGTVIRIGGGEVQGEQMAERVHDQVQVGTTAPS